MAGCTTDGGWGVELIDAARARLVDIEGARPPGRGGAWRVSDETDGRAEAGGAPRRGAWGGEAAFRDVPREVGGVRDGLANSRRALVARSGWERG